MEQDVLNQMISEREAKRDKLKTQMDALDLEIKALREASERIGGNAPPRQKRERPLSATWKAILQVVGGAGSASLDDIMGYAEMMGLEINRNTLRSQMGIYFERGWLERVSDGVYRLTESGARKCDYVPQKNEAPEEASTSSAAAAAAFL